MVTHSGLQKEVLSLYRLLLRAAQQKGDAAGPLCDQIRAKFRENMSIPKMQVQRIEWQLNHGHRQLEMVQRKRFDGVAKQVVVVPRRGPPES